MSTEEEQRLYAQMLETFAELIRSGVDVDVLRHALEQGFMITGSAEQRRTYDALRVDLDAYLVSVREGTAAIKPPEGCVPPPEVSPSAIEALGALAGLARDKGPSD